MDIFVGPHPYRIHNEDEHVYLFRDIFCEGEARVEYATLSQSGVISWHRCEEGASFDSVQPLFTTRQESTK